jgi:hypothetical protein
VVVGLPAIHHHHLHVCPAQLHVPSPPISSTCTAHLAELSYPTKSLYQWLHHCIMVGQPFLQNNQVCEVAAAGNQYVLFIHRPCRQKGSGPATAERRCHTSMSIQYPGKRFWEHIITLTRSRSESQGDWQVKLRMVPPFVERR